MIYPAKWFTEDIECIVNTNVPMILAMYCGGAAYSMTGTQIDLIVKDKAGNVIQSLSSAGTTPLIVIANDELTISPAAFTLAGRFKFYLKQTSGTTTIPLGKGNWIITNE
jgi:hypothetical protein